MKLVALVLIVHPLLILGFSALAVSTQAGLEGISNPGFHGLSQVLYEYASASANNGSGFEGLSDNSYFWNITTGLAMFFGHVHYGDTADADIKYHEAGNTYVSYLISTHFQCGHYTVFDSHCHAGCQVQTHERGAHAFEKYGYLRPGWYRLPSLYKYHIILFQFRCVYNSFRTVSAEKT